ncbi:hypothetical protein [Streptomyces echinatus]
MDDENGRHSMAMEYGHGYGGGTRPRRPPAAAHPAAPFEARTWREFGYVL